MSQTQKIWFNHRGMFPDSPPVPTDDEIRVQLAAATCPLNDIIVSRANEGNMRTLQRFAFTIYKRFNRCARGCNFGIYCPPGQGKTFIVKRFAETIGIPFIFVQSPILDSPYMLFELICDAFTKMGTPIVPHKTKESDYALPPCIVFFDEAHMLKDSLMKGSLLNAMEPDDGYMVVKYPGTKGDVQRIDCYNVCWIAATTERGDLFDAFEGRLTTPIEWMPATEAELPFIVKAGLDSKFKKGEISIAPPFDVCKLISEYQKVPRLAIHGFGVKVIQQKDFDPTCSWEDACKLVAKDIGLNEFGFTVKQMDILRALAKRPIAEGRLAGVARCRLAQVKQFELPALSQYTDGGPYVVSVSGRGICLTRAGLKLLEKMNIAHGGDRITAEYFESKR